MKQNHIKLPVAPTADELQKRIIEAVNRECQYDLVKLNQDGISPLITAFATIQIVTKKWEVMPKDLKSAFRDRANSLRRYSANCAETVHTLRSFIPQPITEIERIKANATSATKSAGRIGEFLRGYRKDHDQGIDVLLTTLFTFRKDFNSWHALSHVLATAFEEVGIDSAHITEDQLRKAADRLRKG